MKKTNVFALGLILFAFSATQANVLWSNPGGSGGFFDWQNGQSLNGLFGDPTLIGGNTLAFFPSNFRAESIDGLADSIYDSLEFELIAHPGFSFQNIAITEYGDYGILDNGQVQVSGGLTITNLDTMDILTATINNDLLTPVTGDVLPWQGWTLLNIGQPNWTHIKITFENGLLAISDDGSIAFIEKKVLGNAITLQVIPVPEPATVAMLSIGLIFTLSDFHRKKSFI